MLEIVENNKSAMIVLHEIYGINRFMEEVCRRYHAKGLDIYCPDLLCGRSFAYSETQEAYALFRAGAELTFFHRVRTLLGVLKARYDAVWVMGLSAGATLAWRCCESACCDGIIGCYGSRIRDYTGLTPRCPTLLLFAEEDSFDVQALTGALEGKDLLTLHTLPARHGFLDPYSACFDAAQARTAEQWIERFLKRHSALQTEG